MNKPNMVIFCSDEHARAFAGCYGHPVVKTPTLDTLARKGTKFTKAYSPSPICVPARASLATGLQVHETRCWSSAEPYHGQIESWMHRMRDSGYTVLSFGKLHFRSSDDDNGFSEEFLPMHLTNNGLGWPQGLLRNPLPPFDESYELAEQTGPGESDYTQYDRKITAAACEWIEQSRAAKRSEPWVLFISLVSPHFPLTAPQEFYDQYANCDPDESIRHVKGNTISHPVLREVRRFWNYDDHFSDRLRIEAQKCYFGLVSFLDDNIRRVLSALEGAYSIDDTVILYTTDHGEMLGHLGFWAKSVMYEYSSGIPLIACGPGFARVTCDVPVSLTDIGVTIEKSAGIESRHPEPWKPQPLQSVDRQFDSQRTVLSEYHDGGTPNSYYMIRKGRWKYVCYAGGHPPHLYDLDHDPLELNDLGAQKSHECKQQAMHRELLQILHPEAVAEQCATDQAARVKELGGRDAVLALASFNHTPVQ